MGQKRRNVELCTDQVYSPKALYAYICTNDLYDHLRLSNFLVNYLMDLNGSLYTKNSAVDTEYLHCRQ